MNANITNLFYVKRAKPNKNGEVAIYQRITICGNRIEGSTGKFVQPSQWSTEETRMIGKSELARSINTHNHACLNYAFLAGKQWCGITMGDFVASCIFDYM